MAGVMARSVSDIAMFNRIFSSCNTTAVNVSLAGYRVGYATNWWANLGTEVCWQHTLLAMPRAFHRLSCDIVQAVGMLFRLQLLVSSVHARILPSNSPRYSFACCRSLCTHKQILSVCKRHRRPFQSLFLLVPFPCATWQGSRLMLLFPLQTVNIITKALS